MLKTLDTYIRVVLTGSNQISTCVRSGRLFALHSLVNKIEKALAAKEVGSFLDIENVSACRQLVSVCLSIYKRSTHIHMHYAVTKLPDKLSYFGSFATGSFATLKKGFRVWTIGFSSGYCRLAEVWWNVGL